MTERLEVRLPTQTMRLLRCEARRRNVPMAQLARDAINLLLEEGQQAKLRAAHALFQVEAPVADWAKMKEQMEEGRRTS